MEEILTEQIQILKDIYQNYNIDIKNKFFLSFQKLLEKTIVEEKTFERKKAMLLELIEIKKLINIEELANEVRLPKEKIKEILTKHNPELKLY